MRRLRDAWILVAVTFLLAASFTSFFGWSKLRVDATAYWQAGLHLRSGEPLYSATPVAALDKAYLYPPPFAAVFAPLTLLSNLWGYAVWMALELLMALALARVAAALAGLDAADRDARRTALALALAAGVVPIFDNLAEGQVNLLVTLLSALAVLEAERRREWRAGFALAAAVHVKLVPLVLVGAWLVWGRVRLVGWTVVGLIALGLLPLLWRVATMGIGAGLGAFAGDYRDFWLQILWPGASAHQVAGVEQLFAPNFSLLGTLSRLFVDGTALSPFPALADRRGPLLFAVAPGAVHGVASVLGLTGLATALWLCRRSAADRAARITAAGLVLLAAALASPSFWTHHLVIVAVAAAGLWRLLTPASPGRRAVVWAAVVLPFVATLTLPQGAAFASPSFADGPYLALREYGLPTAAVLVFFVIATIVTLQDQRRSSASSRATVAAMAPRASSSGGAATR